MLLLGWIVLVGAWVALVELQARSPWLVLAAMAIVWIADTAAYFSGRAFGRRKLAPLVSPGQDVGRRVRRVDRRGAVRARARALRGGGRVPPAGVGASSSPRGWPSSSLLASVSVIGDLFESLLKRHAGVKDSGALLPGHGGILDRTDALLAAMPIAALAAQAFLARPA